jgi:hypothetical protein
MLIVRVHGGLGNQMFQYAIGRHLALKTGQRLRLEIGMHNPSHLGKFDLDRFNIVTTVAPRIEGALLWRPIARFLTAARLPQKLARFHRIYIQHEDDFYADVLGITQSAYLVGWWQDERYFAGSIDVLRRDFTLKEPPRGANARLLDVIRGAESVAVHVRRADYVTNPAVARYYAITDLDYYRSAWMRMNDMVPEAAYFVFSDDIGWCKENLRFLDRVTFVENNSPEQRHEDLRLMSHCKHFIVANSSFSWWGAWLSDNPGKVVLGPAKWAGVFPPSWLRV